MLLPYCVSPNLGKKKALENLTAVYLDTCMIFFFFLSPNSRSNPKVCFYFLQHILDNKENRKSSTQKTKNNSTQKSSKEVPFVS